MSEPHGSGGNGAGDATGKGAGGGSAPPERGAIVVSGARNGAGLPGGGLFEGAAVAGESGAETAGHASPLSLAMLRRELKLIAIISLSLMPLLVIPVWLFSQPEFSATAQVNVEPVAFRILYPIETQTISMFDQYINTQVQVIKSPKVLGRALDQKAVQQTQWYNEKPGWSPFAEPPTMQERFKALLTVQPVPRSQLIQILVTTRYAKDAEVLANAVTNEYLKLSKESAGEQDSTRTKALEDQLSECRGKVKSTMNDRSELAKALGTDSPSELRTQYMINKNKLTARLADTQQERRNVERELSKLLGSAVSSRPAGDMPPALKAQSVRAPYSNDLEWKRLHKSKQDAEYELKLGQARYGEGHWKMKELREAVAHCQQLQKDREAELDQGTAAQPLIDIDGKPHAIVRDRGFLEGELERLHSDEDSLQKQLNDTNADVARASKFAGELMEKDEAMHMAKAEQDTLLARLNALEVEAKAPSRITVAAAATLEKVAAKDRRVLMSVAMIGLSLAVGLGVGYMRAVADPAIHEVRDLSTSSRSPFLGQLPYVSDAAQASNDTLVGRMLQESVRMVRTAMLQRMHGRSSWVVLVTSPGPGAGKTTSAILMARCLREMGKRVLLVDADLRRRSLSRWFGLEQTDGLNALLAGKASDAAVIATPAGHEFDFLSAGKGGGERDAQRLASGALVAALERWRKNYDFVLLDSPPLLSVADSRILAGQADGVIMVLRAAHSRRSDALEAYAGLSASGGTLLGSVLVGSVHSTNDYSRYGYYAETTSQDEPAAAASA